MDPETLVPGGGAIDVDAIEEELQALESPEALAEGSDGPGRDRGPRDDDRHPVLAARKDAVSATVEGPAPPPHAPRFQFVLGALVAIGAVALVAALALIIHPYGSQSGPAWSLWQPGGDDPVGQIAEHVGREYRLSDGNQLVAVTGGPMEVAGLPMQIAMRGNPTNNGDISLLGGKGVLYRLCGLGPKCAIAEGKPSTERHLLLRREALELALYTFRYVKDIDEVVVFMPPRLGQDPSQALLFRHGDVAPELDRPLRATLVRRTPSVAGVAESPDAGLVNRITTQTLYMFSLTQANQDARVFLVLEPFAVAQAQAQAQAAAKQAAAKAAAAKKAATAKKKSSAAKKSAAGKKSSKTP